MGKIRQDSCLIVTATIVPRSIYVSHSNAGERRKEYIDSLGFYSKMCPDLSIYFVENSGYNFNADAEFQELLVRSNISLIQFPPSDKFNEGKGYQEFEMLDFAVDQLRDKYKSFFKITGRYQVLNIDRFINGCVNGLMADIHKKFGVVQTNFFCCGMDMYDRCIKGLYRQANDQQGRFIEKVIYDRIKQEKLFSLTQLFPENPVIKGVSGSYGGTLSRNRYKMMLRNVERKFLRLAGIKEFLFEY